MSAPSVAAPYQDFLRRSAARLEIANQLATLDPKLQKALAELLMIRLFDDFLETVGGIAYRLACGAPYMNGASPSLLVTPARSVQGARTLYREHNRGTRRWEPKWSTSPYIVKTTKFVLDAGNPFVSAATAHTLTISDMQAVRNRIAHKNANSRARYNTVLRRHYGGTPNGIAPGHLLLSSRVTPRLLDQYLLASRIIVRELASG